MKRVDEFWSSFFGLSTAQWQQSQTMIVPHRMLGDYNGAWIFRRDQSLVISVPPSWLEVVNGALLHRSSASDEHILALFGNAVNVVVGPAFHGYLKTENFRHTSSSARLLTVDDEKDLPVLQGECSPDEWEHADIAVGQQTIFGLYDGCKLVAAANYQMWAHDVAMPGLVVHPDYRGRGYGKAALSAATQHALKSGFLVLYQTLVSNGAARAVAQSLGYEQYATHLAVRLRDDGEQ